MSITLCDLYFMYGPCYGKYGVYGAYGWCVVVYGCPDGSLAGRFDDPPDGATSELSIADELIGTIHVALKIAGV